MTEALISMLFVGAIGAWGAGFAVINKPTNDGEERKHKNIKRFIWVWTIFWCLPPLIKLWIAGVLG